MIDVPPPNDEGEPPESDAVKELIARYEPGATAIPGEEDDDPYAAPLPKSHQQSIFAPMAEDLTDAKIATAKAENETALAIAMGEMRTEFAKINGRLDSLPSKLTVFGAAFTAAATIIAGILAAMAWGGDQFNTGRDLGAQIAQISGKLDRLAPPPK